MAIQYENNGQLLLLAAFLASCTTAALVPPSDAARPMHAGQNTSSAAGLPADRGMTATLVKDEEAKKWPHLTRHIGQLLLANSDTEVLIPAAPPLSTGQNFFALTSKVYRRSGKAWLETPWLPTLEIRLNGKTGEALQLVGQDIVTEGGVSSIQAFFRQKATGAANARIVLTLLPDQARIDVKVLGTEGKVPWSLRIGRGIGEDFTIPIKGEQIAGLTSSLLPHALSVIGDQPFLYRQDDSYSYLDPMAGGAGFKILLARDALLKQADLIQSLAPCYNVGEGNAACKAAKSTSQNWKLLSPPPKANEQKLWQAALLYTKQGSFRSLIPIREGETLDLPINSRRMDLLYADSEGVLQKKSLSGKGPLTLTLPPVKKGWLHLSLNPGAARYVELRNAVQKRGRSLNAWVADDDRIILSPNTMLQSIWPLDLALPSGDYHLRIYDGYQVSCDQRFTLLGGRKTRIDCVAPKESPDFSVRASVSVDRAALPDALITASGVRVITSSERGQNEQLIVIPMVAAYDSELGLSMRAFPASEALEKAWAQLIKDKPERSTLPHFSEFIREHDKDASLVLDCPPAGFQLAEYKWIVQSISPDVLEVFGCQQPELSDDLLRVANSLQQKKNRAVRLAAASFTGSLFGTRVPAIYLPRFKRDSRVDPKLALDDLKEGRYTLGFRTEIVIPSVKKADDKINVTIRNADNKRREVIVRIYDQDEKLNEEPFTLNEDFEHEVSVGLGLKSTSRWLRIEVLSRENGRLERGPLFTLATSNFFGLDGGF